MLLVGGVRTGDYDFFFFSFFSIFFFFYCLRTPAQHPSALDRTLPFLFFLFPNSFSFFLFLFLFPFFLRNGQITVLPRTPVPQHSTLVTLPSTMIYLSPLNASALLVYPNGYVVVISAKRFHHRDYYGLLGLALEE